MKRVIFFKITCNMNKALLLFILFFMLNSTWHEIIMLINVEMPTIVGILTFISMINKISEQNSRIRLNFSVF